MERNRIRSLFIFFFIFLPVQYGLIGVISLYHSEPWPAFIFPGFKSVHIFDDTGYSVSGVEFHIWGEGMAAPVAVTNLELFTGIPISQSQGFVRSHFSGADQVALFSDETRLWLKDEAEKRLPGMEIYQLDVIWVEKEYAAGTRSDTPVSIMERDRVTFTYEP